MVQSVKRNIKKRNIKRHSRFTGVAKHFKPEAGELKIKSNTNKRNELLCADRVKNYITRTHIYNCVTLRY